MFDDRIDKPQSDAGTSAEATPEPGDATPGAVDTAAPSPAMARFAVCRWTLGGRGRDATHCGHPEVLPFAGIHGFTPESWCGDCAFFKVKRIAARRNYDQY